MYDLLVKNALVIDGSGAPAFRAEVAAAEGKLHLLPAGAEEAARETVDADGHCLCPGFIDCHSHGDVPLGEEYATFCKVSQGITTQVAGQCGFSMYPVVPERLQDVQSGLAILTEHFPKEMAGFSDFSAFLSYAGGLALTENTRFLVGHVALRIAVMGMENRRPTAAELEAMKTLLRTAMHQGCMGMSAGQTYIPSAFADREELTELCRVIAEEDGVYTVHMRSESDRVLNSIREVVEIGRRSGCRVHISHLKVLGRDNWGRASEVLRLLQEARDEGIRISADQYPYEASMTTLNNAIPPKYFSRGVPGMVECLKDPKTAAVIRQEILTASEPFENQWHNCGGPAGIFVSRCVKTPEFEGKTLAEMAEETGKDPMDMLFELLIRNDGLATALYFCMNQQDIFDLIRDPDVVVGTDGIPLAGGGHAHPRAYGTFPRAIRLFVRENHLFSLEHMVRKMTGLTADRMLLSGKGYVKEGYDADLVLFDPAEIRDTATFQNSNTPAAGIDRVVIGGKTVLRAQKLTGEKPGKLLLFRH